MKLVEDARKAWKWISVQAMAAAAAIQGGWAMVPDDMKANFPKHLVEGATVALLVFGIVGRLVKQKDDEPK
jgi:hypothetical protein